MMMGIKSNQFEGPLDLLLQLIEQEKLSITDIAIAEVTEQFFKHLATLQEDSSEELADFLVVATKLVYLKSKQLLPYLYPPEDEGPSLAEQLKLYKRYAQASKLIEKMWGHGLVAYGRIEPPSPRSVEFVPPPNAAANDLHATMVLLLNHLKPLVALPQVTIDHSVSVKHKIEVIFNKLQELKKFTFSDILRSAESKTEVIVSFLALLELVKQERAFIHQTNAFEEMEIRRV